VSGTVGRDRSVGVTVTVKNTGTRTGTQVVPVYVQPTGQ